MDDRTEKRILSEENFRFEIRKKLYPETSHSTLKFLNSPFVLLIISSVFIGGLGKLYTDNQEYINRENERHRNVITLMAEFNHRYQYIKNITKTIKKNEIKNETSQGEHILLWRAIVGHADFNTALPEYKNNHWGGILARIDSLDVDVPQEVTDAIYSLEFLNENWHFDTGKVEKHLTTIDGFRKKMKDQY